MTTSPLHHGCSVIHWIVSYPSSTSLTANSGAPSDRYLPRTSCTTTW